MSGRTIVIAGAIAHAMAAARIEQVDGRRPPSNEPLAVTIDDLPQSLADQIRGTELEDADFFAIDSRASFLGGVSGDPHFDILSDIEIPARKVTPNRLHFDDIVAVAAQRRVGQSALPPVDRRARQPRPSDAAHIAAAEAKRARKAAARLAQQARQTKPA